MVSTAYRSHPPIPGAARRPPFPRERPLSEVGALRAQRPVPASPHLAAYPPQYLLIRFFDLAFLPSPLSPSPGLGSDYKIMKGRVAWIVPTAYKVSPAHPRRAKTRHFPKERAHSYRARSASTGTIQVTLPHHILFATLLDTPLQSFPSPS